MSYRGAFAGLLAVGVVVVLAAVAVAQEGERPWAPPQVQDALAQQVQDALGATDAEWETLGPEVRKIQRLSYLARIGTAGRRRGGGRRGGGPARDAETGPTPSQGAVAAAAHGLRLTLAEDGSTDEQITEKLAALRLARDETRKELAKAQEELRELATPKQEAQLVLLGLID